MAKTAGFWYQRGEALDYKNTGDTLIEAGTIITIGERIGIAGGDIAPGAVGAIHVEGVFKFAKGTDALTIGTPVTITDGTAAAAESGSGNGYVAADAEAADSTVLVKINA